MHIDQDDVDSLANEYRWRWNTRSKRIARNHVLKKAYCQKRGAAVSHTPIHEIPEYVIPIEPPPQYWHSFLNEILSIIAGMPYRQRLALLMNAQGFTVREIAATLPAATDSVVIWLRKARTALKEFEKRP